MLAYMPPLQFSDLLAAFERVSTADTDRFRAGVLEIWKTIQQSSADLPKFLDGTALEAERREHRYYVHWFLDHLIDRTSNDKLGRWLQRTPRGWAEHAEVLLSSDLVPELITLADVGVKPGGPDILEIWPVAGEWRVAVASDDALWKRWLSLRLDRQVGRAIRLHVFGERDLVRIAIVTAGIGATVVTTAWLVHRLKQRRTRELERA